jgi:hypothetical protein
MSWGRDFILGVRAAMAPSTPKIVLLKGPRLKAYIKGKDTFERLHHAAAERAGAL